MPTNQPRPTKDQRREESRAKAAALREQQQREARRNRIIVIAVASVAIIGLIVGVGFTIYNSAANKAANENVAFPSPSPTMSAVALPSSADETGGVPVSANGVGKAGSEGVTVDIFFDAMCSSCGIFDRTNRDDIAALEQEDGVTLVYRPVAILDYMSSNTLYSTRAANAVGVVADQDPEHMPAFVAALYVDGTQPSEYSAGLTDAKLAEVAQSVGVASTVTDKFTTSTPETGRTFAGWVAANTALLPVNSSGTQGTPSIVINGTLWEGNFSQAGAFKEAVEAAKG